MTLAARIRRLSALLALLAIVGVGRAATTITLRSVARVAPNADVRLVDIATIEGPETDRWSELVVVSAADLPTHAAWREVGVKDVRALLDADKANWSRVLLRGSTVRVGVIARVEASPTDADTRSRASQETPIANGPTVRTLLPARLAAAFRVAPRDVRLTFSPNDAALLDQPTRGRTVELTPTGRGDRVPVRVTLYEGASIAAQGVVRVGLRLKRQAPIATRALRRGARLTADNTEMHTRWVPPSLDLPDASMLIGAIASDRIQRDQLITARDLRAPAIIERGDRVVVHALSGSFVVRTEARATADGAVGDTIAFESLDRSKRRFRARVAGPGRAVLDVASTSLAGETR
ncbi:MAG: flagellar basal body P-ring formation chaperone FlgA [Planctomycetota bacterium]